MLFWPRFLVVAALLGLAYASCTITNDLGCFVDGETHVMSYVRIFRTPLHDSGIRHEDIGAKMYG